MASGLKDARTGDVIHDDGVLRIVRFTRPVDGLLLAGEIDESTYPALVTALDESAGANGREDFHLELSDLEFCDAAGLHAMVRLVDRLGTDTRVVLHSMPTPLRTMLHIVGWDELPGLIVEDS